MISRLCNNPENSFKKKKNLTVEIEPWRLERIDNSIFFRGLQRCFARIMDHTYKATHLDSFIYSMETGKRFDSCLLDQQ